MNEVDLAAAAAVAIVAETGLVAAAVSVDAVKAVQLGVVVAVVAAKARGVAVEGLGEEAMRGDRMTVVVEGDIEEAIVAATAVGLGVVTEVAAEVEASVPSQAVAVAK